jgi:hypothetical protein
LGRRIGCVGAGATAEVERDSPQNHLQLSRDRKVGHLGAGPAGALMQARHAVPTEIGYPDLDDTLGDTEGIGDVSGRPTFDDNTLDNLTALRNRYRAIT